jgi:predicted transcriptional regulator
MVTRDDLHRLVDELPERDVEAATKMLRDLGHPLLRSLRNAPDEDEEITAGERAAIEEGLEALDAGDVLSDEELAEQLGL